MKRYKKIKIKKLLSECETTSDFMRHAREQAGLSRAFLAELSDVSVESILRWERGEPNAMVTTLMLVADSVGVSIEEYVHGVKPTDLDDLPELDAVGAYIKFARKQKGLSAQKLADSIGMCISSIACYENNIQVPTLANAEKIADYLGVSLDRLVGHKVLDK